MVDYIVGGDRLNCVSNILWIGIYGAIQLQFAMNKYGYTYCEKLLDII